MIKVHPTDAMLHAYVAGDLNSASGLVISTHIDLCPHCHRVAHEIEQELSNEAFTSPSESSLDDADMQLMMEAIFSSPPPDTPFPEPAVDFNDFAYSSLVSPEGTSQRATSKALFTNSRNSLPTISPNSARSTSRTASHGTSHSASHSASNRKAENDRFPAPNVVDKMIYLEGKRFELPRSLANQIHRIGPWYKMMGNMWRATINLGTEAAANLIYMDRAASLPEHTHKGTEIQLVLSGSFSDEYGTYSDGDLLVLDHTHQHSPHTADQDCLILAVMEGPLQFTSGISRILNPFSSLFFR